MATLNVKGYPDLTQIVTDESSIRETVSIPNGGPIVLAACATDRGREELFLYNSISEFMSEHGPINFKKYGQVQEQIRKNLNAGARVLFKRIVAPDATLANLVIVATVTNDAAKNKASIKFDVQSIASAKSMADIETGLTALSSAIDAQPKKYPIMALAEVGKGESIKRIYIKPDYDGSEALTYMQYRLVIETESQTHIANFGLDPDRAINGVNKGFRTRANATNVVKAANTDKYLRSFLADVATEIGPDTKLDLFDVLNGKSKDGEVVLTLEIDATSKSLSPEFGLAFINGSAGSFGGNVFVPEIEAYNTALAGFYSGSMTNEIYNTTKYKIALIFGANFPESVNSAITTLVKWRKDACFIRDYGLNLKSLQEIEAALTAAGADSAYVHNFPISYDVIDINSGTQQTVSANYDLAEICVRRIINGPHVPLAGQANGAVLASAIKGTVNFEPIDTPTVTQKKTMKKLRANYASYIDGVLTLETLWTSQKAYTQLSFTNNVFELQDLMRDVASISFLDRYRFINPADLDIYKKNITDNVISKHTNRLKKLEFKYASDTILENQKVYYGIFTIIPFNFTQEEHFEYIIKNQE